MFSALHFAEYLGEGLIGTLILLVIPAIVIFLDRDRNPERKSYLSNALENHFLDSMIRTATRRRVFED